MPDLIDQLEQATRFVSSPNMMMETDAYQKIVAMEDKAVPMLVAALRDDRAVLPVMMALGRITGHMIPRTSSVKDMVASWISWAKDEVV